jgi:MinD superfamily P-loop ATPase
MPEILIISGKGGTGKTSLTAAFSHLAEAHVVCDLDVDAPDLHLLLQPIVDQAHEFWSGHKACIQPDQCTQCEQCIAWCHFGAIDTQDGPPCVNALKCEGCNVCVTLCPANAIEFQPNYCGNWFVSRSRFGTMIHAQLFPGEENSGRLVALLRKQSRELADAAGVDIIIADGPPGIGCPVISALSGTSLAVIVTEPTPSGIHDLERIAELCRHFSVPMAVIINKWDLSQSQSASIASRCQQMGIPVIAKLPHDIAFTQAMVQGLTVTEYSQNSATTEIKEAWMHIIRLAKIQTSHAKVTHEAE